MAVGAVAKAFLAEFGIRVLSHVIGVGPVRMERSVTWEEIEALAAKKKSCSDAWIPKPRRE